MSCVAVPTTALFWCGMNSGVAMVRGSHGAHAPQSLLEQTPEIKQIQSFFGSRGRCIFLKRENIAVKSVVLGYHLFEFGSLQIYIAPNASFYSKMP